MQTLRFYNSDNVQIYHITTEHTIEIKDTILGAVILVEGIEIAREDEGFWDIYGLSDWEDRIDTYAKRITIS